MYLRGKECACKCEYTCKRVCTYVMGRGRQCSLKEERIQNNKRKKTKEATSSDWEENKSTFVGFLWPC